MTIPYDAHNEIRVLIADDHALVRTGLRYMLELESDLVVVGEAADGQQALELVDELLPDVILLDISMPPPDGIEVARRLKAKGSPVHALMLTMHEDPHLVRESLEAGASGYFIKRAIETELIDAIRTVAEGGQYVHPDVNAALFPGTPARPVSADSPGRSSAPSTPVLLSSMDKDLLCLLAAGRPMLQIAQELRISVEQADRLKQKVTERLGLRTRADIVRYVKEQGLR